MPFSKDGKGSGDCKKTYAAWIFSNVVGEWRYMVYHFTEKNLLYITYLEKMGENMNQTIEIQQIH